MEFDNRFDDRLDDLKLDDSSWDSSFPFLARAICESQNGDKSHLYVSDLSLEGAFVLSMKPPPIGEKLAVTLYPIGAPPLPTVDAPVIGVRIDPSDASRTGFEVVFSAVEENLSRQLMSILNAHDRPNLASLRPPSIRPQIKERAQFRVYPRVKVDFRAYVQLPSSKTVMMDVEDISMTGAMLRTINSHLPIGIEVGSQTSIDFLSSRPTEHISVYAQVVRLRQEADESVGASVKFLDMDDITGRRIEGLILDALTGEGSWLYYNESV
jgi:hypothetical protein